MKNITQIFKLVVPYWGYILLNVLFNLLSVVFSVVSLSMVIPFLGLLFGTIELVDSAPALAWDTKSIIDNFYLMISEMVRKYETRHALMFVCVLVVGLFLLKNLFRYLAMYFIAPIRNGVVCDLRNSIYRKVLALPIGFYSEQRKGDIMARLTTDVNEVEWSIMSSLVMIVRDPLTMVIYLVTLFLISVKLTVFVLVLFPLAGFIIGFVGKRLRKQSALVQKKMGVILSIVEETISGLRVIKAFTAESVVTRRFFGINRSYSRLMVNIYRKRDLASPLSEFLGTLVMVVLMFIGGQLVLDGGTGFTAEVFLFYIVTFSQLITPAKSFTDAYYNVQKGTVSLDRINMVLEAEESIKDKANSQRIQTFRSVVRYRDVWFSYGEEPVLKNINLEIAKGQVVAIVGPSGGGKTTLADLLPRFYECQQGAVSIDGVDIRDMAIKDLRNLMGVVTQDTILFNDSVYYNIAMGKSEVSEEQVRAAARIANAHEFISELEDGYYTQIGDRGCKLSGGQRQRLSIARAVLKNPDILVLDEATSALDTQSERLVQDALYNLMKDRTSIVIAHRLSTIQYADVIVVLKEGGIVEKGTHRELLGLNGEYRKLYDLQVFK